MRTWAQWFAGVAAVASMANAQGYNGYPAPPPGQGTYAPQPPAPRPVYRDDDDDDDEDEVDAWDDRALDAMSFRATLAPYGEWLHVRHLGRVWRPYQQVVGGDFQPYATAGHWVYTDYGWSWESAYPWGWAPFHYGRWVYRPRLGWLWRPGREWGPAWVEWREGAGYVGWAPMAPEGITVIEVPNRPTWCFVEVSNLVSVRLPAVILAPERARITFGTTTPIRARRSYDVGTFNLGPPVAHVASAVGHPIHSAGQVFSPHDPFRGRLPDRGGPVVAPPPGVGMSRAAPPPGMGTGRVVAPPPSQPVFVPPPPARGVEERRERREDRHEEKREERHEEKREKQEERREQREDRHDDHDNGHHGGDRRHER